jgi:OOP family OmpA-OmpF porin
MKTKMFFATAMIAGITLPAYASDLYVVGSVGQSNFNKGILSQGSYDTFLRSGGASVQSSSLDNNRTGYKVLLGTQINPYFAVEGGYVDLGKINYDAALANGSAAASVKDRGVVIDALGTYPATDKFSVFGKAGLYHNRATIDSSSTSATLGPNYRISERNDSNSLNYGASATYAFNDRVGVRAEYEQFRNVSANTFVGGKGNVNMISVGLVGKF